MKKSAGARSRAPADDDVPIVVFRERFVFNKRTGAFFTSSREGAFILQAAWRGLSRSEIESEVSASFGISPETAMSDTERFLMRLEEMHLLPKQMSGAR